VLALRLAGLDLHFPVLALRLVVPALRLAELDLHFPVLVLRLAVLALQPAGLDLTTSLLSVGYKQNLHDNSGLCGTH
jgi:hypothetical protein